MRGTDYQSADRAFWYSGNGYTDGAGRKKEQPLCDPEKESDDKDTEENEEDAEDNKEDSEEDSEDDLDDDEPEEKKESKKPGNEKKKKSKFEDVWLKGKKK